MVVCINKNMARSFLQLFRPHDYCPKCGLSVRLVGNRAGNPDEDLIARVIGNRSAIKLHRLEDELADAIYYAELRSGAATTDVGIWGHAVFHKEAVRIVTAMRPEFGLLVATDVAAREML